VAASPAAFLAIALASMLAAGKPLPAAGDFGRFRLYNLVAGTQAAVGAVAAVVSTLVRVQVLVAWELRARRRGRPSVLGPASVQLGP
jgi:hypothetical protein